VGLRENTDGSEGIETECKNPDCAGKTIKRIANWIEKNSILGIGDVVLEALSDQLGIETPADLYRLTVESLANLDMDNGKYGESRARMVYDNIQKTRRKMTLRQFLGSLSIRFLGRRRVEMIQEKCPGQMDTLADWQSDKLLTLNAGVDNMAPVILEDIRKHKALIEDLLKYIEIVNDDSNKNDGGNGMTTAKGNELSGKTFVFTGKILSTDAEGNRYTREMLHYKVMDHSGNVDTKIKASTEGNQYYLVQADPNSTSTKTMDAKKKGATIISETDFWTMINEQPGSGSAAVD
jgi:DNA ligase (NAD+)